LFYQFLASSPKAYLKGRRIIYSLLLK